MECESGNDRVQLWQWHRPTEIIIHDLVHSRLSAAFHALASSRAMSAVVSPLDNATAWQRRFHYSVLFAWTSLLLLVWGWSFAREVTLERTILALVYSLPLGIALPGLVRGQRYTHAWATLCVLPYLIVGVTESVANAGARWWAGAILASGLLLFIALIAYLRVTRPITHSG